MRRAHLTAAAVLATITLAGCSSSKTTAPAAAPPAASKPAAGDAKTVTLKLATAIPTVKLTVTYDGTTDPNQRLGRPHQYLSKTAFDDSRVSGTSKAAEEAGSSGRDSICYGGTVEVFATVEDAQAWAKSVGAVTQALSGLEAPDYIYQHGKTVVRVSNLLTAEQAAAYDKAVA